jgi:hypothetical protein
MMFARGQLRKLRSISALAEPPRALVLQGQGPLWELLGCGGTGWSMWVRSSSYVKWAAVDAGLLPKFPFEDALLPSAPKCSTTVEETALLREPGSQGPRGAAMP